MFNGKQRRRDHVDIAARDIIRAAAPGDEELETAISSPLFWCALRTRIEREQKAAQGVAATLPSPPAFVGKLKMAVSLLMIIGAIGFWLLRVLPGSGQAAGSLHFQDLA